MEKNLVFSESMSVEQFKVLHGINQIDVLRNEKSGKCFFTYGGGRTGAVTSKYPNEPLTNPIVSEVINDETGDSFYLLHNKGDKSVTNMTTL